ncbi:MAG: hypothetical protein R3D29_12760 [Nitratireductor sp.]
MRDTTVRTQEFERIAGNQLRTMAGKAHGIPFPARLWRAGCLAAIGADAGIDQQPAAGASNAAIAVAILFQVRQAEPPEA